MNLSGKILVAPPNMRGNFWQKTVILVTENHDRGSIGFVMNKESKMSISEFANQCNVECNLEGYVHVGGPVNVKALTLIHSPEWHCENTMQINEDFAVSSHHLLLQKLASGDCPDYWKLVVGLCAWTPGQLESEIKGVPPYDHNFSWLTATPSTEFIFELSGSDQWHAAIELAGMEFVQKVLD